MTAVRRITTAVTGQYHRGSGAHLEEVRPEEVHLLVDGLLAPVDAETGRRVRVGGTAAAQVGHALPCHARLSDQ